MKIYNVRITFFLFILCFAYNKTTSLKELNLQKYKTISEQCEEALDFYLERPDLEAEYFQRLSFCENIVNDISPKGYQVNPIISDFKSNLGVNGRTRMNVHQGIDIIGSANEFIIAIANGKVLETSVTACEGPSVVIDHGVSLDNKKLITIYSHVGEFTVKEGDTVKRGYMIDKLKKKIDFPCMARVRHLHLQIGQKYCEKEEKNTWGCNFYIKDLYSSLNPNDYWADGPNKVTCFNKNKKYKDGTLTYPFKCNKIKL